MEDRDVLLALLKSDAPSDVTGLVQKIISLNLSIGATIKSDSVLTDSHSTVLVFEGDAIQTIVEHLYELKEDEYEGEQYELFLQRENEIDEMYGVIRKVLEGKYDQHSF
ncbi:hypothetical protein DH09_00720 (plasmid) [Bacillaceae bacterium JMAK1]|nr:hypothetical protein DH09_00720 [Bacillaceae bacterium JMAK1]